MKGARGRGLLWGAAAAAALGVAWIATRDAAERAGVPEPTEPIADGAGRPLPDAPDLAVPSGPPNRATGVFGAVFDLDDRPVAGVRVLLRRGARPVAETTTGPEGEYLVGPVVAASRGGDVVVVVAEREGLGSASRVMPVPGMRADLVLEPTGDLRIEVRDALGRPVPRAVASVGATAVERVEGDADGVILCRGLPAREVLVRVNAPGGSRVTISDLCVVPGTTLSRRVRLAEGVRLEGQVIEESTGNPVPRAEVWDGSGIVVRTDDTGTFSGAFGDGGSGVVQLSARAGGATGRAPALRRSLDPDADPYLTIRVSVRRWRTVTGRVVDASESPAEGAIVTAGFEEEEGDPEPMTIASDARGAFALRVPGGDAECEFWLWATSPTDGRVAATARTDGGPVTLRLGGAGRVEGSVRTADGAPVEGAVVSLRAGRDSKGPIPTLPSAPFPTERLEWETASGADGSWRLEGVPTGSWTAGVNGAPAGDPASAPVVVEVGSTRRVEIVVPRSAAIEGRVLYPEGRAAAGAWVIASDSRRRGARPAGGLARTDVEGRFALRRLPPGPYDLRAVASGYSTGHRDGVETGTAGVDVRLVPPSEVTLTIEGPDGAEWKAPVEVRAARREEMDVANREDRVFDVGPEHGRRLLDLAAGVWVLVARTEDGLASRRPVEVVVEEGRPPVRAVVRLERAGAVRGVVVDAASRAPLAGAEVSLRRVEGAPTGAANEAATGTDAEGRWKAAGLSPGTWRLLVRAEGRPAVEEEFDLAWGEDAARETAVGAYGSVRVLVVDRDGRPVPGARVRLKRETGSIVRPDVDRLRALHGGRAVSYDAATRTDADGRNERNDVSPGRVTVTVRHPARGGGAPAVTVDVPADGVAEATTTWHAKPR